MQGKLIVFEGTDGSGKATQSRLLCEELTRRGIPFRKLEFPRYQEESSALIRLYLGGAFGDKPGDVNAYAASVFYSVDRYASYKQDWGAYYEQGGLVIADRYTTSNAVHQTGKLPPEQREGLLSVLANDPRPRYQDDPQRVYGMTYGGRNVRFRVEGGVLTVLGVE